MSDKKLRMRYFIAQLQNVPQQEVTALNVLGSAPWGPGRRVARIWRGRHPDPANLTEPPNTISEIFCP